MQKKASDTITYKQEIIYTNGSITKSKSFTCDTRDPWPCESDPSFLAIGSLLCDMNGKLFIASSKQYLEQVGFTCTNKVTVVSPKLE